jgi:hypothetical protein
MTEKATPQAHWLFHVHRILFSLNVAYAVGYALLIYGSTYRVEEDALVPASGLKYLFFRSAVRINSFLHLNSDSRIGGEVTFALSVLCLAALLFLIVRITSGTRLQSIILGSWAGVTSLFAVPACWLLVVKATLRWFSMWASWPVAPQPVSSFWDNPPSVLVASEIVAVGMFFLFVRNRSLSAWAYGVLTVHCMFWVVPIWIRALALRHLLPASPLVSPAVLFTVFPLSAVSWLLHLRQTLADGTQPQHVAVSGEGRFVFAWSVVPLALLSILWLPARGQSVAHPKDIQSVVIKLTRTQCFGVCPEYTITIHGGGLVHYLGRHNVGVLGEQTGAIPSNQLLTLLRYFDDLHFFSLKDGAFERCDDTPKVSVFLSVDGKEQTVASDAYCAGTKSGPQADFVRLTHEIDRVVASDRWVRCGSHCLP